MKPKANSVMSRTPPLRSELSESASQLDTGSDSQKRINTSRKGAKYRSPNHAEVSSGSDCYLGQMTAFKPVDNALEVDRVLERSGEVGGRTVLYMDDEFSDPNKTGIGQSPLRGTWDSEQSIPMPQRQFSNILLSQVPEQKEDLKLRSGKQRTKSPITPEFIDASSDDSDCDFRTGQKSSLIPNKRKVTELKFQCGNCDYKSGWKSHLTRHQLSCGKSTNHRKQTLKCPEGRCDTIHRTMDDLDSHVQTSHGLELDVETFHFGSENNLNNWLNELQSMHSVKYIARNKSKPSFVLYCNRSSQFKRLSNSTGRRNPKKIGSVKCGRICLSRIKVTKSHEGLKAEYRKTHTGHTINPGHIGLTSPAKREICDNLIQGIPKNKILANIRSNFTGSITRMNLCNMKDLHNIAHKFKVNHLVKLDENDAVSVDATIKKMELEGDSGVFIYKPQGKTCKEYPTLSADEFVLGYMNKAQEDLLHRFGGEIICFDGTHGTTAYGFEMSTLITVDDQHQGFPLLFFFHSSKSQETYELLFRKLKERVGALHSKVFMSDDEPAFYNAWEKEFGSVDKKLLCTWHVLRNWNKHLVGLEGTIRRDVWTKMRAIMQETDSNTFEDAFSSYMNIISSQEVLSKFHAYISNYYVHRKEEWAHCYRLHAKINTNMHIERMHRDIKHLYLNSKKCKRLDVSFAAVRSFLTDKMYDRLITMYRTKLTTKEKVSRSRHDTSVEEFKTSQVVPMGSYWIIPSSKGQGRFYEINSEKQDCQCSITCPKCRICLHKFKCSCPDNSVRFNMCKHMHLLGRYLMENTAEICETLDDDLGELLIDTWDEKESRSEEALVHSTELTKRSKDNNFNLERTKSLFQAAFQLIHDEASAKILDDHLKIATGLLKVHCSDHRPSSFHLLHSSQGNIEKQLRFVPLKKKAAQIHDKSNDEIIEDLVMKTKFLPVLPEPADREFNSPS